MPIVYKQLGQLRPGDLNAASLYSPGASTQAIIFSVFVANNTGAPASFRLFVDDDGAVTTQVTALYYDEEIAANTTKEISLQIAMNDSTGNLSVRTSVADALTFTAFGAEIT